MALKFDANNFLSNVATRANLSGDEIKNDFLKQRIAKVMAFREEHPNVKMPEVCKAVGLSESTVNRSRRDLGMKPISHYSIPLSSRGGSKKNTATSSIGTSSLIPVSNGLPCPNCDHAPFKTPAALKTHITKMHTKVPSESGRSPSSDGSKRSGFKNDIDEGRVPIPKTKEDWDNIKLANDQYYSSVISTDGQSPSGTEGTPLLEGHSSVVNTLPKVNRRTFEQRSSEDILKDLNDRF